mmetsp:Transcript_72407/g.84110  ORF Transcript_72407/g.84110 Transcript_72407/m.84110 type:complete len:338 (-) Transcript_72407:137-1150(-)
MSLPIEKTPSATDRKSTHTMQAKKAMDPRFFRGIFTSPRSGSTLASSKPQRSTYRLRQVGLMEGFFSARQKAIDFQILHESKMNRPEIMVSDARDEAQTARATNTLISPRFYAKRNPILQDNEEEIKTWKTSSKKTHLSHKTQLNLATEEEGNGLDNEFKIPDLGTKPRGMRYISPEPSKSFYEARKRELKTATIPSQMEFNPITEGDPKGIVKPRTRDIEQTVSPQYQKMVEKKVYFPSARIIHIPKRMPNKDQDPFYAAFEEIKAMGDKKIAPLKDTPDFKKGTMKNLLSYNYAADFREQSLTGKVGEVPFSTLQVNIRCVPTSKRRAESEDQRI